MNKVVLGRILLAVILYVMAHIAVKYDFFTEHTVLVFLLCSIAAYQAIPEKK